MTAAVITEGIAKGDMKIKGESLFFILVSLQFFAPVFFIETFGKIGGRWIRSIPGAGEAVFIQEPVNCFHGS
jgi:hypothetical protein